MRWRDRRGTRDFDDEVQSHIELETDRLIGLGHSPEDARAAAHRSFGNVTSARERFYESQRVLWLDRLKQNVRSAIVALAKHKGFSVTAVLSLALGVGVNSAVFTMFYAFALRPLPLREADRLAGVYQSVRNYGRNVWGSVYYISFPEYLRFREENSSFGALAAYHETVMALGGEVASEARAVLTSCNYFRTLQARTSLGRDFSEDECAIPGAGAVAVLSEGFWRRRYGADSTVLGRTLLLNQVPLTIIGVAEEGFSGTTLQAAEVWVPVTMHPTLVHGRDSLLFVEAASWLQAIGRLKTGVTRPGAEAELQGIAARANATFPERRIMLHVTRASFANSPEIVSEGSILTLGVLAVTGMVLAMACANLMNLLLARALARRREIAVRLSLGATRRRLIEQLFSESLLLALLGGAGGVALAYWLPEALLRLAPDVARVDFSINGYVLLWTLALAIGCAVLFGLVPALHATRVELTSSLKNDMVGGPGRIGAARLRRFLVGAQVAGSALLLAIGVLFVQGMRRAQHVDPGYITKDIVAISLNAEQQGYDAARIRLLYDDLMRRFRAVPGVEDVAIATFLPIVGRYMGQFHYEAPGNSGEDRYVQTDFRVVSGSYFSTMGVRIVRGRVFNETDPVSPDLLPVVVSQALVQRLWPDEDPLMRRVKQGDVTYYITGVASDVQNVSLGSTDGPFFYVSVPYDGPSGLQIIVRAPGQAGSVMRAAAGLAREADPNIVVRAELFEDRIAGAIAPARAAATGTLIVGALALTLAFIGVYGVISYTVTQRRREIGIRLALGAQGRGVVALVMKDGMRLATVGVLVGTTIAVLIGLALRGMLFGLSVLESLTSVGVAVGVLGVALLATYGPARRAARIDPVITLRDE